MAPTPSTKSKGPGRPSKYSKRLSDQICFSLMEGNSLRSTCKTLDIHKDTVLRWAVDQEHPFSSQYALARRIQAELMLDEILEIADDSTKDTKADGQPNKEHMMRARLRVDTRKWAAGKLAPKRYGDRLDLKHSGKTGGPVTFVMNLSDD